MIHTITQAKNRNEAAGFHFFDPASVRFFGSRLPRTVIPVPNGALFVTSEQFDHTSARLYTIRFVHDNGNVETVGAFQGWQTNDGAKRVAKRMASVWTSDTFFGRYSNDNGGSGPVVILEDHGNGIVRFFWADDRNVTVVDGGTVNLDNVTRF